MRFSAEEYIEKEKVLKILFAILSDTTPDSEAELSTLCSISIVRRRKSPDVVPVVRCKDCKFYYRTEEIHPGTGTCDFVEMVRLDNDFCSKGERSAAHE